MAWSQTRTVLLLTVLLLLTGVGTAHEVYVLPAEQIEQSMEAESPDPFTAAHEHLGLFTAFLLGVLVIGTVAVFFPCTNRFPERYNQILQQLKPGAAYLAQATLGIGLIASAMTQHLFGPEIALHTVSDNVQILSLLLYLSGIVLLFNLETRISGLFALFAYIIAYQHVDGYALHYVAYMGLALFVILQKKQPFIDEFIAGLFPTTVLPSRIVDNPAKPYLIFRITYGLSIIYAAVYAKYLYSNLALATIEHHMLAQYLPVAPLFAVLCILILELLVGTAVMLGVAVRFAAMMILLVNVASFITFQEALWPHIWLIGGALVLFAHGYDEYTLGDTLAQRVIQTVQHIR